MRRSKRWVSFNTLTIALMMVSVSPLWAVDVEQRQQWSNFASKAGWLYQKGQYQEAVEPAENALRLAEKIFTEKEDQQNLEVSINRLGSIYRKLGRNAEAEPLYKRLITIREELWGRDSLEVARVLNNLAAAYKDQAKYSEAVPINKRSLAIREKVLGRNHPNVAKTLNILGVVYNKLGRYAEAESIHTRALAIQERFPGPQKRNMGDTLNNLGWVTNNQGQ